MASPRSARTDGLGEWRVDIPTPAAGGPHELRVHAPEDGEFRVIADVWIGGPLDSIYNAE